MGVNLSWMAFETDSPDSVCELLGLEKTGKEAEDLPRNSGRYTGVNLKNGWYVVLSKEHLATHLTLDSIARAGRLVSVDNEEMLNYSSALLWNNGEKMWEIEHHPQRDGEDWDEMDLKILGDLPPEMRSICERLLEEQKTADHDVLFDAPLRVAELITGFNLTADRDAWVEEDLVSLKGGLAAEAEKSSRSWGCTIGCVCLILVGIAFLTLGIWRMIQWYGPNSPGS